MVIVAIMALGVGVNTAVFTLVSGVLWKQLPYRDPQALVSVWSHRTDRDKAPLSIADFENFREQNHLIADLAVFAPWGANLAGNGDPERLTGVRTTANVFALLGVAAAHGRLLRLSDDDPGAGNVVVIGTGCGSGVSAAIPA